MNGKADMPISSVSDFREMIRQGRLLDPRRLEELSAELEANKAIF